MRTYKNVPTTRRAIDKLKCDVCHVTYDTVEEIQEFILIDKGCGAGSVFGDQAAIQLDLCQHCFHSFFGELVQYVDDFADWEDFVILSE